MSRQLQHLGWTDELEESFRPHRAHGLEPARVTAEHRGAAIVHTERGEATGHLAGALLHGATSRADLPAVGDWVAADVLPRERRATIRVVLPRRSSFTRKEAGFETEQQVLAANVDVVFVVAGLDGDLNIRRLERYLTLAWGSGADPVIVLSKSDECPDVGAAVLLVEGAAGARVPVRVVSALTGTGMEELHADLLPHRTGVLLGSSGVGKSTIVNALSGRVVQKVRAVREDGRGRHTTTHRQLIPLPGGGLLIDTPGMRELQLWDDNHGLDDAFEDVAELAAACRFSDCAHGVEPGCAVREAVEDGTLPADRLESYHKLERELRYLERKRGGREAVVARRKAAAMSKSYRRRAALER